MMKITLNLSYQAVKMMSIREIDLSYDLYLVLTLWLRLDKGGSRTDHAMAIKER
jgi:hypothetical protein